MLINNRRAQKLALIIIIEREDDREPLAPSTLDGIRGKIQWVRNKLQEGLITLAKCVGDSG